MWKKIFVGWCIKASIWRTCVIWVHLQRKGKGRWDCFEVDFLIVYCSSTTWTPYSLPNVIVFYLICMGQRGIHSNFSKSKSLDSLEFVNLFWVWQIWWFWCITLVTFWWNWWILVNFGEFWSIILVKFDDFFGLDIFNIFHYPNN